MRSRVVSMKSLFVPIIAMSLSACGGGSSESGGVENDVTSCITTQAQPSAGGLTRTTFTNTCDFAVNFGRGVVQISSIVTLEPGGTDAAFIPGGFIACRPPSQPFDRDDSAGRDFACTG